MLSKLTPMRRRIARRRHDERGVVAVMMALCMLALVIASAMVMDLGLVRVDRQVDKSAADSAALAGAHALYGGNSNAYGFAGVCSAIAYLQNSDARFSGLSPTGGTWTDGAGTAVSATSACTDNTYLKRACSSSNLTTWAKYSWSGTFQTNQIRVSIQSGYVIPSTAVVDGYPEDSLAQAAAEASDNKGGCNQVAVIVTQNRKPGFGSLARSADLVTTVRSVARSQAKPTGDAPAMLLLKRTGCPTVAVGSTAGSSWIKVKGALSQNGLRTQPGTIHSDSDGSGCSDAIFFGKATDGIIAYAAPKVGAPTTADPLRPGQITSVAAVAGVNSVDSATKVYGSTLLSGSGGQTTVSGRPLVSRSIADYRYLSGVRSAISGAQSNIFNFLNSSTATAANGWSRVTCSGSGVVSTVPTLTSTGKLFVDCGNTKELPATNAGTVVFAGSVSPSATISLPQAHHVYVFGGSPAAIDISNNTQFSINGQNIDSATGKCTTGQTNQRSVLFVKTGPVKQSAGTLRLCNTTVYMMGGKSDGCLPSYTPASADETGPAPTTVPCAGSAGDGQYTTTGGDIDWTAPNKWDQILDDNGIPDPTKAPDWLSVDGPEDLALWDESYGGDSNPKYQFTGGGVFNLRGVFMVPNADPISLSGSANFDLKNAQFVASSLALASNNTTLTMTVDPNSAVALQKLQVVGLVR
jgi:Flp pilus assembly protein TadG